MDVKKLPSDFKFGYTFALLFLAIGIISEWLSWEQATSATLFLLSAIILYITLTTPSSLGKLNRGWFTLGSFLSMAVNPLILTLLFLLLFTPYALVFKFLRRDKLNLKHTHLKSGLDDAEKRESPALGFRQQF